MTEKRICGNCAFFQCSANLDRGFCHYNPPNLMTIPDASGVRIRGQYVPVERSDKACHYHVTEEERDDRKV